MSKKPAAGHGTNFAGKKSFHQILFLLLTSPQNRYLCSSKVGLQSDAINPLIAGKIPNGFIGCRAFAISLRLSGIVAIITLPTHFDSDNFFRGILLGHRLEGRNGKPSEY